MSELHYFKFPQPFNLERGDSIPELVLAYTTHGKLNNRKDNVIWIFHALTANSDPTDWWPGLVGEGKLFDPTNYFIICVNMPGSCYGSTYPFSIDPIKNSPYFHDFSWFTPKDMIRAYSVLKSALGISSIKIAIGGSMGGMQALEWAIEEPELIEHLVLVATNANHSPWGIAFNTSQRLAIEADVTWSERNEKAGTSGLIAARSIALLSYRNYKTYALFQQDQSDSETEFRASSYQQYQGKKLADRFNAFSYVALTKGMDAHNTGRGRGGCENALKGIKSNTLVIGIESDILFPVSEQQFLADKIPGAEFHVIDSDYGHDGFLLEYKKLELLIEEFLKDSSGNDFNNIQKTAGISR